jgi:hypothetical protein
MHCCTPNNQPQKQVYKAPNNQTQRKIDLSKIDLNNLDEEGQEAKNDIEIEWNGDDGNKGYKDADFLKQNYANIKYLKQHLKEGYREYEKVALKIICLKLKEANRFEEFNAIINFYNTI